jgi:hypothetical protein
MREVWLKLESTKVSIFLYSLCRRSRCIQSSADLPSCTCQFRMLNQRLTVVAHVVLLKQQS